ncbi:hypothetical protein [Paractinoplanes rishiriensis]|nr:hypothetical protein [Actinoplanes rishiriensis]
MSNNRRRSHAWLATAKGEPGEPFLPKVGELYLITTTIFALGNDPGASRPGVVIVVPAEPGSRFPIEVVTRTSRKVPGVSHPADRKLSSHLDKDGVFSTLTQVEQQLWRPENVMRLGVLTDPYLSEVLRRFAS